jgi:cytochrome P450
VSTSAHDPTTVRRTTPETSKLGLARSLLRNRGNPLPFLSWSAEQYGDVVHLWLPGERFYQLNHPDAVRHVLVDNAANYTKGRFQTEQFGSMLVEGLFMAEGEQWRRDRQVVGPAFGTDRLEAYTDVLTEASERLADDWADGEVHDVAADLKRFTLDAAARTFLGVDLGNRLPAVDEAFETVLEEFRRRSVRPVTLPAWVPTPHQRRYRDAMALLDDLIDDVVAEKRDSPGDDVVSAMLAAAAEEERKLGDREIRDQVLTLLVAGHESTSMALTYAMHVLARQPAIADELRAEFGWVLGDAALTPADLRRLSYAERFVTEVLRLYPPAWGIIREAVDDDEILGIQIPAGASVTVNQWVVHRDPRWYVDPLDFDPDRWLPEAADARPEYAYFAFGAGARRCVGARFAMLEMTIVLATLLRRFDLRLESAPTLELGAGITTYALTPVVVRPTPRSDEEDDASAGESADESAVKRATGDSPTPRE